ncbi:hypothetical protein [Streptantibioticus cattleyicolor]|nr:hypothetical protein [Streptantibioticus cattleyicolor]CCB71667.1 protein of unknown function [Streptantibioticus cattleyicolor NRRL 8057 = DSM 46488]
MGRKNTQTAIKDLIGDVTDSVKKAIDEVLDRDEYDPWRDDWSRPPAAGPLQGVAQAVSGIRQALVEVLPGSPAAALINTANLLTALGLAGAAGVPPVVLGQATPVVTVPGPPPPAPPPPPPSGAPEETAALTRQVAQLSDRIGSLLNALEGSGSGAARTDGAARPAASVAAETPERARSEPARPAPPKSGPAGRPGPVSRPPVRQQPVRRLAALAPGRLADRLRAGN